MNRTPTQEEIKQRAAYIRASWPEKKRRNQEQKGRIRWTPPRVPYCHEWQRMIEEEHDA